MAVCILPKDERRVRFPYPALDNDLRMELKNIRTDLSGMNYRDRLHRDFFQFTKYQGRPLVEHGVTEHVVNSIAGRRRYILNGKFGRAMQKHVLEEIKDAAKKEGKILPTHVKNLTRKVLAHFGEREPSLSEPEKPAMKRIYRPAPPPAPGRKAITSVLSNNAPTSIVSDKFKPATTVSIKDIMKKSNAPALPPRPSSRPPSNFLPSK